MQTLDFKNTQIAFRAQSDLSLRFSYWIFRILSIPFLVRCGTLFVRVAFFLHLPVKALIRATVFKQFCGGEDVEESLQIAEKLSQYKVGTILDYAVEAGQSETLFDETTQEIIRTIEIAKTNAFLPFSVFKVTGVARFALLEKVSNKAPLSIEENLEWNRAKARVQALCAAGARHGIPVFIDAEESWIQNAVDALAHQMMAQFNKTRAIIYNTVQMYRVDKLNYVKQQHAEALSQGYILGLKVVRGAYLEKEDAYAKERGIPSLVHSSKSATDKDYDACIQYCLEHVEAISFCAGTHNDLSTALLAEGLLKKGISPSDKRIYFSQLKGMSDNLSFNLADAGFNVAKYVPYGPVKVLIPYLTRRARENTAMAGQSLRELALICHEMMRRKISKVL